VESVENQTQVFHASHRPLKIPQRRRDFHIPTAWACAAGARDDNHDFLFSPESQNQRKEVGRYAASSFFLPPRSLWSSATDFMLIFQLENARGGER